MTDGTATLAQLRECSEVLSNEDATREAIDYAKEQFMDYIKTLTPKEHMHLTIDMIATLEIRDEVMFVTMIRAVVLHTIETLIGDTLGDMLAGRDDASKAESEGNGKAVPPVQE